MIKNLKDQFKILCKSSFDIDTKDLQTETQTLCHKRAHTQGIY